MYLGSKSCIVIILFLASAKGRDNMALNTGDREHKSEPWTLNVSWYNSDSIMTETSSSFLSELRTNPNIIHQSIDNTTFSCCLELYLYIATVSMSQPSLTEN